MNWEAIGAVGEVLGAVGVIATLGYLAVIASTGITKPHELSEIQRFRFETYLTRLFRNFENFYYQHTNGAMEDHLFEGMKASMVGYFHSPGVKEFWAARGRIYSPRFRDFLESQPREVGEERHI